MADGWVSSGYPSAFPHPSHSLTSCVPDGERHVLVVVGPRQLTRDINHTRPARGQVTCMPRPPSQVPARLMGSCHAATWVMGHVGIMRDPGAWAMQGPSGHARPRHAPARRYLGVQGLVAQETPSEQLDPHPKLGWPKHCPRPPHTMSSWSLSEQCSGSTGQRVQSSSCHREPHSGSVAETPCHQSKDEEWRLSEMDGQESGDEGRGEYDH